MAFLTHLFTGKDNTTGDLGRVLWAFFSVALAGHEALSVVHGQPFDPIAFATASAALMAGGGAALGLKAKTEPGA
jgi:hypothetical protein